LLLAKDNFNKKEITQNLSDKATTTIAATIASIPHNQPEQLGQQTQQMQLEQKKKLEQQHKEAQECYEKIKLADKEMIPVAIVNNECIGYKETTDVNGKINKEYIKK